MSVNEKMTAIADNIRSKTGGTETLTLDDMASGVNEVYEAGRHAFWREWWDTRTNNNTGTNAGSLCLYWSQKMFDLMMPPPYAVWSSQMGSMFAFALFANDVTDDILDMSRTTYAYRIFQQCSARRIETIDISKCKSGGTNGLLRDAACVTVDKLIFDAEGKTYIDPQMLLYASSLKNVYSVEGLIAGYSLTLQSSPLTAASAINFIKCLANYAGTENKYAYTITFSGSTKTALDAEGNTSPNGNTWREYVGDLGWNFA